MDKMDKVGQYDKIGQIYRSVMRYSKMAHVTKW